MAQNVSMVQCSCPGAFAFTGNVAADDTVVIGNWTYTFAADPDAAMKVDVGEDLDGSITNLVAAINASGNAGGEYGDDTAQNPYVTATADLANGEVDLVARGAGCWANAVYLAATSLGANAIDPSSTTLGASSAVPGEGVLDDFIRGLFALSEVNSELFAALSVLTDAAD